MSQTFDVDNYFEIMKTLTEIPIEKAWEKSIKFHISNAKKMSDICESVMLEENSIDLSNTFNPGEA